MKLFFAAVAVSAFCCVSVHANDAAQVTEMKSQLAGLAAAFNKGDSKAVGEFFAVDATLINPQGVKADGRAKIAEIIQTDLFAVLKNGKSEFKFLGMRSLGPDTAFVDSIHEIAIKPPATGMTVPPMKIQFSGVAKKIGGKWLWLDARPYAMMSAMMGNPPPLPHGMPPGAMPPGMSPHGKMMPPGPHPQLPHGVPPGAMPPGMKSNPPPPPAGAAPPPAAAGQVPKAK